MSDLFIIIQARMTSTRLPKKILMPLCGKTVLEVMLDRLGDFNKNIIIATTDDGTEEPIVEVCKKSNIRYFKGSVNDVLSRYFNTAKQYGAKEGDTIVRLTSDCPLIDPLVVKNVIQYFIDNDYDYVSNVDERTYPRGFDTEVFSFETLEYINTNAETVPEREHVTYLLRNRKHNLKMGSYVDIENNSRFRLTLDEEDDYKAIAAVYEKFDCKTGFSYAELLKLLKEDSSISRLNDHVEQKKV